MKSIHRYVIEPPNLTVIYNLFTHGLVYHHCLWYPRNGISEFQPIVIISYSRKQTFTATIQKNKGTYVRNHNFFGFGLKF